MFVLMLIPWTLRMTVAALKATKPALPFTGREFEMPLL